jgi:hypothetical protein
VASAAAARVASAADPASGRVVVRFEQGAPADEQARFATAVRAELAGVAPVDFVAPGTLVVVRVTWTRGGATLSFEDASGATVAPPRTVLGETADIVASQAASIVRATAIALREAATLTRREAPAPPPVLLPPPAPPTAPTPAPASAPASAPAPTPTPEPAPAPPSEAASAPARGPVPRIVVDAFYTGAVYAADVPWRSGIRLDALATVARWEGTWLYGGLGYSFDPPIETAAQVVTLRVTRHAATALAGLARSFGSLRIAGEIGPVLSDTLRSTRSAVSGFDSTADHAVVSVGAVARARAALVLAARSHVDLSAGLSAYPWGEAYVVQGAGEASVFAPYRIQPEASLGVGYDLW